MKRYLLVLLLLPNTGAFAELNKWVDKNGEVHYSDQPPPEHVKSTVLRSTASTADPVNPDNAAASTPVAQKTIAEREAERKKAQQAKKEAADKAAQEQAAEEARKSNCLANQQNLRTLQNGVRMMEIGANGERSYMDDAERQRHIVEAQQGIAKWCK